MEYLWRIYRTGLLLAERAQDRRVRFCYVYITWHLSLPGIMLNFRHVHCIILYFCRYSCYSCNGDCTPADLNKCPLSTFVFISLILERGKNIGWCIFYQNSHFPVCTVWLIYPVTHCVFYSVFLSHVSPWKKHVVVLFATKLWHLVIWTCPV